MTSHVLWFQISAFSPDQAAMASSDAAKRKALALKDEGNQLFCSQDFTGALAKYEVRMCICMASSC